MRLGLITYDARHLKTEQVALGLALKGTAELSFHALPFTPRPARNILFAHRPDMEEGAHSRDVAAALGAPWTACASPDDIPADAADLFLILGAGLLPAGFVAATRGRVLNSHPGLIPLVRGLDAFKWAILDGMPIANTLHWIDEEADAGEVLAIRRTPVFLTDTLQQFARRHYESEIAMMVDFEALLAAPRPVLGDEVRPARMRMPAEKQAELETAFEAYKARFAWGGAPS
ncbi:formyltransferase family protein [Brevundimonas sp.]|jgi:phosphoribosylglycinamide formyltransferase-1|uniref:formyltransferase family protein n=1 Tax=Brevundimonas sp. TaxID=1871086 RepID=UPI002E11B0C0|nr:formyltransferase family protein [Brevundimonas sp.]